MSAKNDSWNSTIIWWILVAGLFLWFCLSGRPYKTAEPKPKPSHVQVVPTPKGKHS